MVTQQLFTFYLLIVAEYNGVNQSVILSQIPIAELNSNPAAF